MNIGQNERCEQYANEYCGRILARVEFSRRMVERRQPLDKGYHLGRKRLVEAIGHHP